MTTYLSELLLGLDGNDLLEPLDDGGEGMWANSAANEVMRGADRGDPLLHGLIDGILEGLGAFFDAHNTRAKQLHAEHVELLSLDVLGTHVHDAVETEQRADGGSSHTMLTSASLRNNTLLAQTLGHQRLAERVGDLVRASVVQILALEPDGGAALLLGEAGGLVQTGGTREVVVVAAELGQEGRIVDTGLELLVELHEGAHQRLRDVHAAEGTHVAGEEAGEGILRSSGVGGLSDFRTTQNGTLCHVLAVLRERLALRSDISGLIVALGGVAHSRDDSGANHETIKLHTAVRKTAELLIGGDTEADGDIRIARGLDRGEQRGQSVVGGVVAGTCTSDTEDGNGVDEGVGCLGDLANASLGGSRGQKRDVGNAVLAASSNEGVSFVNGKIGNNEAGDASLGTVTECDLIVRGELGDGIVCRHQHNGSCNALFASLFDVINAGSERLDTVADGNIVCCNDCRSVHRRVGERNS